MHPINLFSPLAVRSKFPYISCTMQTAVEHVIHIINRISRPLLANQSPFDCLYKSLPNLSNVKSFGCLCSVSTLVSHCSNFDIRARKRIFI